MIEIILTGIIISAALFEFFVIGMWSLYRLADMFVDQFYKEEK